MTLVAVFTRASTDDASFEVEVEDVVFDFDCVEDATTDRVIARVQTRYDDGIEHHVFLPVDFDRTTDPGAFDTLTVMAKR